MKPDTSSNELISMDYEGMYGSDKPRDYRDYLVDLKGDGDKRYLIVTTYNGGNSAYSFEGYLLDAKDNFAFVGMIPVHEITRYPAKNPDLIFKFCEEISYFGAMGTAAVSILMKLEKGKAPSLVIPKEKPFDLRPHQEYLKHLLGNSLKRKYAVEPAIYVLYCSLASEGKIKAAQTAAKLLGFTKQEIEEYGNACLERLRRCESYPLLVRINQGEF